MEVTEEQAKAYYTLTSEKQKEHNKNLYDFMLLLGYEDPETQIYDFVDLICEPEQFYICYEKIMDVYYGEGKNTNIIHSGMTAFEQLNMFTNSYCCGRFFRLQSFFLGKLCEEWKAELYQEKESEKVYEDRIIKNFNDIFPDYTFVSRQVGLKGVGIIDILAEDKESKRKVIIELKVDKSNPNRQLLSYSTAFENPILVALTKIGRIEKSKHKDIIYKVYE